MSPNRVRRSVCEGLRGGCIALGMLALLLVGCAILAEPTPTPEPVTITLVFPADLVDHYDELIQEFNAQHPYITVERRSVQSPQKWEMLFREKEADVFFFTTDGALFQDLYDEGRVLSLTPFLQESDAINLNDFYPDTLGPVSLGGSVWGIPSGVNMAVMYYNKDLFDQNNAPYPKAEWTWDDFVFVGSEAASVARASIESMVVVSDIPDNLEQGLEGFIETLTAILDGDVPAEQGMLELQRQVETR